MFPKLSKIEIRELIKQQIESMIHVLTLFQNGTTLHMAVDFSEIHQYAIIDPEELTNGNNGRIFLIERIIYIFLFEYLLNKYKIYLLPPYVHELDMTIGTQYWTYLNKETGINEIIQKLFDITTQSASEPLNRAYNESRLILNVLQKCTQPSEMRVDDKEAFIKYIKNNSVMLYGILSIGVNDPLRIFNKIKSHDNLIKMSNSCSEILADSEPIQLKREDIIKYSKIMDEVRPNKESQNYRDAAAYRYIEAINERIYKKNQILVFITRAGLQKKWPQLLPIYTHQSGQQIQIIFHPISLFIYLINKVEDSQGNPDIPSTIQALREVVGSEEIISYTYQHLSSKSDQNLNSQARIVLEEIIHGEVSLENLKIFLKLKGQFNKISFINKAIKLHEAATNNFLIILSLIFKGMKNLMDYGQIQEGVKNEILNLENTMSLKRSWAIDLSILLDLAEKKLISPSAAEYAITINEFNEEGHVFELYNAVKGGALISADKKTLLLEIFNSKKSLDNKKLLNKNKAVAGCEAALFIVLLKLRAYNSLEDKSALRDIERVLYSKHAKHVDHLIPLFKFVRNIVLFRLDDEVSFKQALSYSRDLAIHCGDVHPRYRLQHGYFLMRNYRDFHGGTDSINNAIEITIQAERQTESVPEYKSCYRLSLSNLANMYAELSEPEALDKALYYLNKLNETIKNQRDEISMFKYTRAHVFLKSVIQNRDTKADKITAYQKALPKLSNELKDALDGNRILGYTRRRYEHLLREYEEYISSSRK